VVDRRRDEWDQPIWNLQYAIKEVTPDGIRKLTKARRLSIPAWGMQNGKLEARSLLIHTVSLKRKKMLNLQCRFDSEFLKSINKNTTEHQTQPRYTIPD
jgi:hypothetical protein